jgi:hypothetical protein
MAKSFTNESTPKPDYPIGYGKPPESGKFKPGQSGNPQGKRKGQPSLLELTLAEAARIVKVKHGDKIVHLTKKQVIIRRLLDQAAKGDLRAARIILETVGKAEAAVETSAPPEPPLTEEELALLKEMTAD